MSAGSAPYHVCFVVPDIERAMAEMGRAVGTRWSGVLEDALGEWEYRLAFSRSGPPYLELVQGPPGSPWDATGGPRCHHLGYWTDDVTVSSPRLTAEGFPLGFTACPLGRPYAYHELPGLGVSVELMDRSRQERFLDTWAPGAAPMPTMEAQWP